MTLGFTRFVGASYRSRIFAKVGRESLVRRGSRILPGGASRNGFEITRIASPGGDVVGAVILYRGGESRCRLLTLCRISLALR
jgi:hypothetical protein